MTEAKHEQAVGLLTGLDRFVRLVVEREMPLSQANSTLTTPSDKSPRVIGSTPRPYTGLYSPNSYMANRVSYARRSTDSDNTAAPPPPPPLPLSAETLNGLPNGVSCESASIVQPQPAPRHSVAAATAATAAAEPETLSQEEIQVSKPITNEEFQAMIPAHFLRPPTSSPSPDSQGPTVTVTIKQPDNLPSDVSFPPAPTTIGKVTETITKSTLTETVVTRVTDNHWVQPVIIEVSPTYLYHI